MEEFGDRGSDVPWWVKHPLFKGLVVAGLVVGALSPVLLKVMRKCCCTKYCLLLLLVLLMLVLLVILSQT